MLYQEVVEIYEALAGTTKRLEKADMLAPFLHKLGKQGKPEWVYLLQGKVMPDHDSREFGISTQLVLKALAQAYACKQEAVLERFKRKGDLGELAEYYAAVRKQALLSSKPLQVERVFTQLRQVMDVAGKGAVEKKLTLIGALLAHASPLEAKYLIRTLVQDLRIGVQAALIVDALCKAFPDSSKEAVQKAYDSSGDFALVFLAAGKGKKMLETIGILPGRPLHPMLAVPVQDIAEGFEVCGKPAALEFKYDGFRLLIHKSKRKIQLFTRRLDEVSTQFPDVVQAVEQYVQGTDFILDAEAVGFDQKTGKYLPFEAISRRIKRKHDIQTLLEQLPVEVNVFDILYYEGKSVMEQPFLARRKLVEQLVDRKERIIRPSELLVTGEVQEAEQFYEKALEQGEEGIMIKNISARYQQGRKVGYMVKLKPVVKDLDLVIVGAEHGTGKRAGWLTSYSVACRSGNAFLEVGKVSSGLKEKEEEGMTYAEMTKLLKPLLLEKTEEGVKVQPKVVMAVTYQNIQKSPSYSSGYALRFPRISAYRPDRGTEDIASLKDIEKAARQ